MKKQNKDGRWVVITVGVIIGIILLAYVSYGIYLNYIAEGICYQECNAYGGLHSQRIVNGEMDTNDLCICYFDDSIKTWRLGIR